MGTAAVERSAVLDAAGPSPKDGEAADPAGLLLMRERRATLMEAVRGLSEPHRLVITCRYLLELDEEETAAVLGWRASPSGMAPGRSPDRRARRDGRDEGPGGTGSPRRPAWAPGRPAWAGGDGDRRADGSAGWTEAPAPG
jgi:hypothetical protein